MNDESLGMHKILELIQKDETLCNLEIVYPSTKKSDLTSSICVIDRSTNEVYVLFVGNYASGDYQYTTKTDKGKELNYETNIWVDNFRGAEVSDTDEQKIQLDFYKKSIAAARAQLGISDEKLDITVSGHSAGGNSAEYVTIA